MKLQELIGLLITRLDRKDIQNYLISIAKIGGRWWRKITAENKIQYASMMRLVLQEDPDSDYHLGSDEFQAKQIGRLPELISKQTELLSDYYLEKGVEPKDKTFNYPQKLLDRSENSKSAFILSELFKNTKEYQMNPNDPKSRSRRYILGDKESKYAFCKNCSVFQRNTGSCVTKKCAGDFDYYQPNPIPPNAEAERIFFDWLDMVSYGIDVVKTLDAKQQVYEILHGMAPNTNSGYPFFKSQKKQIIPDMWKEFVLRYAPNSYAKHKQWFKAKFKYEWYETKDGLSRKRSKMVPYGLQAQIILDVLDECIDNGYIEVFAHFYRTQISDDPKTPKHRSVFGGGMLNKVLGGLFAAAKVYGETRDVAEVLKQKVPPNWVGSKFIPTLGNMPFMAQLNWEEMFSMIKRAMPLVDDEGELIPMTNEQIAEIFGFKLKAGDYVVDVVGEDFPGYDTGIIEEDIEWMTKHKKLGKIIKWIFKCLTDGEVWIGGYKLRDIFFKSGHPLTSPIGSGFHIQIALNVRDWIKVHKNKDVQLLGGTVLSDDSIFWWIGFEIEWMQQYLKKYGLSVKETDSYIYSRDKIVGFLKNLIGYVLRDKGISIIGDPISRELAFLHSEKDVEEDILDNDLKGVYEVTGDIDVDSGLSKLASSGRDAKDLVYLKLMTIRDTPLGRKIIRAIDRITPDVRPYRPDVIVSYHPIWLKEEINVRELLVAATAVA